MGEGTVGGVSGDLVAQRAVLIGMIGERAMLLHGPSDEASDFRLSGSDLDCVVLNMDPLWPLRLPAGWRLCQCLRYDLGGWYWVLERAGEVVALDTIDDPWGSDATRSRPIRSSTSWIGSRPKPSRRPTWR